MRVECPAQALLASDQGDEFDLGTGQVDGRGNAVEVFVLGRLPDDLVERQVRDEHLVDALLIGTVIDTEGRRCVALRVQIDDQHMRAGPGERSRKVHGGRGLAYPALLIGDREHTRLWGKWEFRLVERDSSSRFVGEFVSQGSASVVGRCFT